MGIADFQSPAHGQAGQRRTGLVEYEAVPRAAPAYIVIVGAVERSSVLVTRRMQVRLDEVLQRAGGLTSGASGSVSLFRRGQPRMQLTIATSPHAVVLPGDTIVVASGSGTGFQQAAIPKVGERLVPIVCHHLADSPLLLRLPAGDATVQGIARLLGQELSAIPPVGIVLPAAQPTLSPTMRLPTGTMLFFDAQTLNRVALGAAVNTRHPFEPVVNLDEPVVQEARVTVPAGPQVAADVLFLPPPTALPLTEPQAAALAAISGSSRNEESSGENPLRPLETSGGQTQSLLPTFVSTPGGEMIRDRRAVAAAHETTVAGSPGAMPSSPAPGPVTSAPVPPPTRTLARSIDPQAFGWGLGAGAIVGVIVGLAVWSRKVIRATAAMSSAELPIQQTSATPPATRLHGKVVGDRRLKFDPPHETVAGPHFGTTQGRPSRSSAMLVAAEIGPEGVAASGGGGWRGAGNGVSTESSPDRVAAPIDRPGSTEAPAVGGGLLDRVLMAMRREREQ